MQIVQHSTSAHEISLFHRRLEDGIYIYLLSYVDSMLMIAKNMYDIIEMKRQLNSGFETKDLGVTEKMLHMERAQYEDKVGHLA